MQLLLAVSLPLAYTRTIVTYECNRYEWKWDGNSKREKQLWLLAAIVIYFGPIFLVEWPRKYFYIEFVRPLILHNLQLRIFVNCFTQKYYGSTRWCRKITLSEVNFLPEKSRWQKHWEGEGEGEGLKQTPGESRGTVSTNSSRYCFLIQNTLRLFRLSIR